MSTSYNALDRAIKYTKESVTIRRVERSTELAYSLNLLGELYQDLFCTESAIKTHCKALRHALDGRNLVLSTEAWRNLGLDFVYQGRVYKRFTGPREVLFASIFAGALALMDERIAEGEALLAKVQDFWQQIARRGRAFHVLMFADPPMVSCRSEFAHVV